MTDDLFLLALGLTILGFLVPGIVRRLGAGRRAEQAERLRVEAAQRGLRLQVATGEASPGAVPGAVAAPPGALLYSGSSAGLAWTAQVEVDTDPDGAGPRRAWRQRTRLTFPGVAAAPGAFFLAMALPPGVKLPDPAAPGARGFLGKLADQAAEGLLDLYVGGTFGAEHRALVNAAGAARPAGPEGFLVLSTDASLAAGLLDDQGQALLAGLRQAAEGTPAAWAVDRFGLLATSEGLTFACQVGLSEPAALRGVAERVARLAVRVRSR
ncbi:MAG: hypothetical protein IPO09_02090 [Anaeromyxobacter sp.]|nr:hypothetical protein [Anaeromyxobacter sp.]